MSPAPPASQEPEAPAATSGAPEANIDMVGSIPRAFHQPFSRARYHASDQRCGCWATRSGYACAVVSWAAMGDVVASIKTNDAVTAPIHRSIAVLLRLPCGQHEPTKITAAGLGRITLRSLSAPITCAAGRRDLPATVPRVPSCGG